MSESPSIFSYVLILHTAICISVCHLNVRLFTVSYCTVILFCIISAEERIVIHMSLDHVLVEVICTALFYISSVCRPYIVCTVLYSASHIDMNNKGRISVWSQWINTFVFVFFLVLMLLLLLLLLCYHYLMEILVVVMPLLRMILFWAVGRYSVWTPIPYANQYIVLNL